MEITHLYDYKVIIIESLNIGSSFKTRIDIKILKRSYL